MKKVKKYIIASFLLVASSLVFFGCASKNESKIELKDWGNTTDTAEFGEEYQLREYVYDKNGNAYNVDATVMLGKDEIKIVDNFFTVENFGTYTINYSTNAVSQIVTTTLTIQERVDTSFLVSTESDGETLSQEETQALGFSGTCAGAITEYSFNANLSNTKKIPFTYTYAEMEEYKAQGYSNFVFYVGVNSQNEKAVRLLCRESVNQQGQLLLQDYTPKLKTWQRIRIPITTVQNVLFNTDETIKEDVSIFSGYMAQNKRVNENGTGVQAMVYMSEILIDESTRIYPVADGEICNVYNESSLDRYTYTVGQGTAQKTLATEADLAKLTGDYQGNAIKLTAYSDYSRLFFQPRITEQDWDEAVAKGYKNLYYWVAYDELAGTDIRIEIRGENSLQTKYIGLTKGEWKRITIELTEENKQLMFHEDGAKLFLAYRWDGKKDENGKLLFALYVGDCGFDENSIETPPQEVAFVYGEESVSNFKNISESGTPTLASQADLETLTGEYTGNAVKITTENKMALIGITPRITEEDWDKAVAAGYTKMYIWVAATITSESGSVTMQKDGDSLQTSSQSLILGQWTKLTYDLTEENKAILFAENGGRIARFYPWTAETMNAYVGDCGFDENSIETPPQEDEIRFVSDKDTTNGFFNAAESGPVSKATAEELATLTGDYQGESNR